MMPKAQIKIEVDNINDQKVIILGKCCSQFGFIEKRAPVLEIETSKSVAAIEAPTDGYIFYIYKENDEVSVGSVVALIFETENECKSFQPNPIIESDDVLNLNSELIFSAKARELMLRSGLTESDFSGLKNVKTQDVELILTKRNAKVGRNIGLLQSIIPVGHDGIVLYGAGLQGCIVKEILETQGLRVAAFVDSRLNQETYLGLPVFRPNELNLLASNGIKEFHICIGNYLAKNEAGKMMQSHGFKVINVIDQSAYISPSARIGVGVFIGPQVLIGPEVRISDWCQINNAATIAHHSEIGEGAMISDGCHVGGTVQIGSGSVLGIGVTVNREVKIGSNCSIVSGISVTSSVSDHSVVKFMGVPYLVVGGKKG
jgi:sugar O-acyltransferase (sialic acid O-acetyltransferase NeuD family)